MINQQCRNNKQYYKTFFISRKQVKIDKITQCSSNDQIYGKNKGFFRRVNVTQFDNTVKPQRRQIFQDPSFTLDISQIQKQGTKIRRLYDVYEKQFDIFENLHDPQIQIDQSFIDYHKNYCSFLAQFGLIDKIYLQSIFNTRKINQQGYYEYFVRRNGEYHLQYIDDKIPVTGPKQLPLWGMSYLCPWELLLLKAWIKQKNGIQGVINAQPFQFLYAFGLPGYAKKNIKKQLDFLKKSTSQVDIKKKKQQRLPLNNPEFSVLAKTRSDRKVQDLGLVPNCLGYKIIPIKPSKSMIGRSSNQKTIYKIHSTIPAKWIGSLSVVNNNPQLHEYDFKKYGLNLQKQFLATQQQVLAIFSKYYIAKDYYSQYQNGNNYQDSYMIKAESNIPTIYRLNVLEKGVININIEVPIQIKRPSHKGNDRWPYIKYFLSKITDEKSGVSKSGIVSQKGLGGEFEPNLSRYEYFDIEFVKGYNRSSNRFLNIQRGQYYMYVKIQNSIQSQINYQINISSSAKFSELGIQKLNSFQHRQLVDSTIFQYAKIHGEKYVIDKFQHIYLGNTFRQIGFGFMALELRQLNIGQLRTNSKSKITQNKSKLLITDPKLVELGIRIYPQKMKKLQLSASYYQQKDGSRSRLQKNKQPISMVCRYDYPKIIVFDNPKYDFKFNEDFPEPQTVEVYSMKKK